MAFLQLVSKLNLRFISCQFFILQKRRYCIFDFEGKKKQPNVKAASRNYFPTLFKTFYLYLKRSNIIWIPQDSSSAYRELLHSNRLRQVTRLVHIRAFN